MKRILVAECMQEISSFNPVITHYDDFAIKRGEELFAHHRGIESYVSGALKIFEAHADVDLVPLYGANAISSGPLLQTDFERLASELLDTVEQNHRHVDGFYFALHGAMGATEELDPEGFLLREVRQLLGPHVPIVISLDLHGILTQRMLENCDALTLLQTYPHVDFTDTGARAARLLMRILEENLKPVMARVVIPTLVRGDELITETGIFGDTIRQAQRYEQLDTVLAAGMIIGNPFTDVPELCSQSIIVTNDDTTTAEQLALELANDFWPHRTHMQARLIKIGEAISQTTDLKGTAIFADAADATSSGASGDSNYIISHLLTAQYEGSVLAPLVDASAVKQAMDVGIGNGAHFSLGGTLDSQYTPLKVDATVAMLRTGPYYFESWDSYQNAGDTAVLQVDNITIIITSSPVHLFDRSLFLAHGYNPQHFDLVVVKSPHCQERFFTAWAAQNFNIDAPGSTSANLQSLGHSICKRPMYPLEKELAFEPVAQIYS